MKVLSDESDEQLVNLLKQDSERAFTVLYNRYWDRLLQVAYYKLGSQEEAEEVLQQVFLELWEHRLDRQLRYSFATYISSILKYTIYNRLAERRKRNAVPIEGEMYHNLADHSTQNWLDFSEIRGEIETLVVQLPEKCQMVYRLSREEWMTAQEISENMQINKKTVEGHLTKALKFIKENLSMLSFLLFVVVRAFF
ncbi:putative RNA polymerase ECF-type sigma factor [Pedobacter sp. BAL39]|uniref:sigma-70 family RNA polymerase sigma factor n=1 Tax=Pedobacter sp. BAL39 TaxID=391596 RepID=UPI0001559A71|nr:sigma-70 family RNA polymerase sigma factor [Pedobacter sp. BAL39]EDM38636.1 putative RNA polymerase ECF-type sigma factor [Pedobacter sp. BAL39]